MVDHRADRLLRGDVEVRADARRAVETAAVHLRCQRAGCRPVLRRRDRAILVQREPQRGVHRGLDPCHADLSVALRGVSIAAAEEGAVDLYRQKQRRPADELARVQVAAERSWRHHRLLARTRRAHAHGSEEGRDRDGDVVPQIRHVAAREIEDLQVRIGEVVRQQPEAGQDRRPAPALRMQVDDLDRERMAGLGAVDGDRASERVDTVPIEQGDRIGRRLRRDLVVAHVARVHDDRVAARNRQHRLVVRVPGEVHPVCREIVASPLRTGGWEDAALRHDSSYLFVAPKLQHPPTNRRDEGVRPAARREPPSAGAAGGLDLALGVRA